MKFFLILFLVTACQILGVIGLGSIEASAQRLNALADRPRSDSWMEGRIQGALDFNNYYDTADVDVNVSGGIVTLTGEVQSDAEKIFAEKIGAKLSGNQKVVNNIEVNTGLVSRGRSDLEQFVADAALLAKINTNFTSSKSLLGAPVEVKVDNGIVYLNGTAYDERTKAAAGRLAESVYGVRRVRNQISVNTNPDEKPDIEEILENYSKAVSDAWISSRIRSLVQFSTDFPANEVSVLTKAGHVELKGSVQNGRQKELLTALAADVIGVRKISNSLTVRN